MGKRREPSGMLYGPAEILPRSPRARYGAWPETESRGEALRSHAFHAAIRSERASRGLRSGGHEAGSLLQALVDAAYPPHLHPTRRAGRFTVDLDQLGSEFGERFDDKTLRRLLLEQGFGRFERLGDGSYQVELDEGRILTLVPRCNVTGCAACEPWHPERLQDIGRTEEEVCAEAEGRP